MWMGGVTPPTLSHIVLMYCTSTGTCTYIVLYTVHQRKFLTLNSGHYYIYVCYCKTNFILLFPYIKLYIYIKSKIIHVARIIQFSVISGASKLLICQNKTLVLTSLVSSSVVIQHLDSRVECGVFFDRTEQVK